ncbi:hypothetical protein N0V93_006639 [Gnomoniopsis smithogilvyi]|uniref:Uncharacterized protein n=1 Tax=Gnomoniopsis smithogilvyi TaxID=1191159 RepID=A0A9W8YQ18_9PEZI|nr:hypothetical protein N0V93_006639 [Gnomoniopsis smithogilvyi]
MSSLNAQSAGDEQKQKTYKEQLDEAASKPKTLEGDSANQGGVVNKVIGKVTEYVPAAGKVLGQGHNEAPSETESKVPGPPDLPHHETQVEEFVRDQHRSRKEDGKLADA